MEQRIADFLINTGLYGKGLKISKDDMDELKLFLEETYKIDAYCCDCDSERIFTVQAKPKRKSIGEPMMTGYVIDKVYSEEGEPFNVQSVDELLAQENQNKYEALIKSYPEVLKTFHCAKDAKHTLTFCCLINNNRIIKYGQYPSLADLNNTKSKKYRKILGKKYSDYNAGIGLHSHGVGAGSLVYLRRIFEDLIEEAHQKASNEPGWDEKSYPNRMPEKILKLKDYLPEYLVENRKIYSILSKGIHELPEDTCIDIFPIVRVSIELILDEKMEKEERERKKKETAIHLQNLESQIVE
ncbi:hypothetical protein ACQJ0Y_07910 [Peribacillus simplex]|uniref:hypothetical protein n=1 Tax=Peribacillus simplex TaxID=1478 RepID=UPI003CE9F6F5